MENKRVVFSDKKEAKFLMIVGVLMALALFLLILISDIIRKNEHLLHNLFAVSLVSLAMMAITVGPALIIRRFKIEFDYLNREIIYVPYFKKKRSYSFDEIKLTHHKEKGTLPTYEYHFNKDGKRLFKLSELEFTLKTKESEDYLKILFTGLEKKHYDWEKELRETNNGIFPYVYGYSLEHPDKSVVINRAQKSYVIDMNSDEAEGCYHITVSERNFLNNGMITNITIEKIRCTFDQIDRACRSLVDKYSKI